LINNTWEILGQDGAVKRLTLDLIHNRIAHAYLIVGPPNVGKYTLATRLAQALNCTSNDRIPCLSCTQCTRISKEIHADISIYHVNQTNGSRQTEIGIGDVRQVERKVVLKPYEGSNRVLIFRGAEHLSEEASNALLKVIEGPPPQNVFILLTDNIQLIPATILSRCRRIDLHAIGEDLILDHLLNNMQIPETEARLIARLAQGRLGWALQAVANPELIRVRNEDLNQMIRIMTSSLEIRFEVASQISRLFYHNRSEAGNTLNTWKSLWRDMLIIKYGNETDVENLDYLDTFRNQSLNYSRTQIAHYLKDIIKAEGELESNVNARTCLEALFLNLPSPSNQG